MAGMVSARPLSQILPHDFDLFPESPTPIEQRFQSPPSPRPQRRSHYRPFSTLYTESPYIELDDKPTRLKRSSSVGGLQAFPTMGINFIGKDKSKSKKDSPRLSPNISEFGESVSKVSTPLKLKLMKSPDLQRPSTSTGLTRPSPTLELPRLKKKRSMASLFSSSDSTAGSGITPESVVAHSPLSGHHVITPPPRSEDATAIKTSGTNKAVTFKEHTVDLDAPDIFVPKGIWAKRHNMTLHPYRGEVPYMQAYEPVLLESDRYTDLLLQRLSHGQPSFHDFGKKPPATALDLGCGRGHWIIHAANVWKNTQITGFDLVDIPLAAFESTENAHFVQGNFLDFKLPFPDKSFEYVRMANLVLCIPKKKWEAVFAEARRVLTPGGRLEVIDDEMHFPYGQTPEPDNNRSMGPILSYVDEDADNDMCDGDTLQGEESAETESTLWCYV
ncbi:hypothetical protein BDZ97DRAFT_1919373 [Flammula alnicola]|nr:hypothetical protein BDZ97DRAFT_1919373 [Flammula alnicola]